jgi:hypothetical protein
LYDLQEIPFQAQDIFNELFKRTFNCISSSAAQFAVEKTYICTAGHVAAYRKTNTDVFHDFCFFPDIIRMLKLININGGINENCF